MRLCELPRDMWSVAPAVRALSRELDSHGLPVPVVYASDGFFAKDGRFAIAVPFYLLSAWLVEVERAIMGEVEGESDAALMRLLRHEAAHALDSHLSLFKTPTYRRLFGDFNRSYPTHYRTDLTSDNFVRHLPLGYAQAHPAEDFAETLAVWLDPAGDWQRIYRRKPAIRKLKAIDEILDQARPFPPVRPFRLRRPLEQLRYTVKTYYQRKLKLYGWRLPPVRKQEIVGEPQLLAWATQPHSADEIGKLCALLGHATGLPFLTASALIADVIDVAQRMELQSRTNKSDKLPISALSSLAVRKIVNLRPGIPV